MDKLVLYSTSSYLLLLIAFIYMYYAVRNRSKFARYSVIVMFIVCGTPLTVALVNDAIMDYVDANIGLGLCFMLTWAITILVFLLSLIIQIRNRTRL